MRERERECVRVSEHERERVNEYGSECTLTECVRS
jgi:hypothetical protein